MKITEMKKLRNKTEIKGNRKIKWCRDKTKMKLIVKWNWKKYICHMSATIHMEIAINMTLSQSSIIIRCSNHVVRKHSSKKSYLRCLSSVGFIKIYVGYFSLGAPTSEGSVFAL